MADEKKILLQLEIDADKSITELVTIKDRIKKLKDEQKQLNTTTLEGKKTYEAYQAQIKALTKEQKSLELAVEKTAAGFEFEAGSIAHNRAELSRLTAEYKNLANPTKEQTQKIKDLSDRLKEQEAAIGNTSRNVGNYKESIQQALQSSGLFGTQIQAVSGGFNGLKTGIGSAVRGFTTLKGAIAATGIGLLLLAFGALVAYFRRTDDGATKLEAVMSAVGAVIGEVTGYIAELGATIFGAFESVGSFKDAMEDLGQFLIGKFVGFVTAPIKAFEALYAVLRGDTEEAARLAKEALDGVTLGASSMAESLSNAANRAIEAAKAGYEYAIALDAINDRQRDLNVQTAKNDLLVQRLNKNAADKTKTDEQRIKILLKANDIEEKSFNNQFKLEQERLKLIEDRNKREQAAINQRLMADIEEAKTEQEKIKLRQKLLSINDDLAQEEADQRIKVINLEKESILLREKNVNKILALQEKIDEANDKAAEAEQARLKKTFEAEQELQNNRIANQIRSLDSELNTQQISNERRERLLIQRAAKEIELERTLTKQKLTNLDLEESEKTRIKEDSAQKEIEIKNNLEKAINEIDQKSKEEQAKNEKKLADDRRNTFFNYANAVNTAANAISTINNANAEKEIKRNEKRRKDEIEAAGNNRANIQQINEKYDRLAEEERKTAARKDATIKTITATINTAVAVTQTLASTPYPASIALAAAQAAAGAAEIYAIQAQADQLEDGGLLSGPSHAAGGIRGTGRFSNVEVEGGEFVVNKRATRNFLPLLKEINAVGNRKPMRIARPGHYEVGGIIDGGISARNAAGSTIASVDAQVQSRRFIESLPPPIVLVQDIDNLQSKRTDVKSMARVTR